MSSPAPMTAAELQAAIDAVALLAAQRDVASEHYKKLLELQYEYAYASFAMVLPVRVVE
jgi:hypothetical protein